MRHSRLAASLRVTAAGVAGAAAAGSLVVSPIIAVSSPTDLGISLGIGLIASPVVLLLGLLLAAPSRRGWLLGIASGAGLGALVSYWLFAALFQSSH